MRTASGLCAAALLAALQPALAAPTVSSASFGSCEAAKRAVKAAGRGGLYIDRRPDRTFDDPQCYRESIPDWMSVFEEWIRVNGRSCLVGYSCSRTSVPGRNR